MFTATLSVRSLLFSLALAGLALLPATASPADPYTVNTQDDYLPFLPSDPKISLRSALNSANSNPGPDEIILPAGIYTLTITGSGDDTNSAGDLDIRDSVTITGAGPDKTIIDGNAIDRVFDILFSFKLEGISVVLKNLTIQNGRVTPTVSLPGGAGIQNRENLSNSHFAPKRALLNGIEGFLGSIGGCVTHSCGAFSARRSQATCFWGPLGSFRAH